MLPEQDLTSRIIRAAFRAHNTLGPGHLEHVYQNALAILLRREGHRVELETHLPVLFEGLSVGYCEADLIVDGRIVVETKATGGILPGHAARMRAYLRCSGHEVGLILNFGPVKVDVRREDQSRGRGEAG